MTWFCYIIDWNQHKWPSYEISKTMDIGKCTFIAQYLLWIAFRSNFGRSSEISHITWLVPAFCISCKKKSRHKWKFFFSRKCQISWKSVTTQKRIRFNVCLMILLKCWSFAKPVNVCILDYLCHMLLMILPHLTFSFSHLAVDRIVPKA